MSRPFAVGDSALAIFHEAATGLSRCTVVGAALVSVETVAGADAYGVRVIRGCGIAEETTRVVRRRDLFARDDHEEHRAFGAEVRRLWGGMPCSLREVVRS